MAMFDNKIGTFKSIERKYWNRKNTRANRQAKHTAALHYRPNAY